MKTYSIRCTAAEHKRIFTLLDQTGYTLNALAKTALFRVVEVGMSDFQRLPQGRVIRRGKRVNRSERLHSKLDPQVVSNFKAALSGSGLSFLKHCGSISCVLNCYSAGRRNSETAIVLTRVIFIKPPTP